MPSYYCPELLPDSSIIRLEGEEYHHLARVKRIAVGELIQLNSGSGLFATARVESMDKNGARVQITELKNHAPMLPRLGLAFALLKGGHDELIVEKCTELGAIDFFPFLSRYGVRSEGKNTLERFRKTALSAIKQCDNPFLPAVHPVCKFDELLSRIHENGYQAVLCSEIEKNRRLRELEPGQDICFIIGPEGGFSKEEFAALTGNCQINLAPLITRAETAAIAACAQFLAYKDGIN